MSLEKETQTYEKNLPELLKQCGKFVLIKGDDVIAVFDSYEDALKVGYDKFGLEEFMVNEIQPNDAVQYFSRGIQFSCHA